LIEPGIEREWFQLHAESPSKENSFAAIDATSPRTDDLLVCQRNSGHREGSYSFRASGSIEIILGRKTFGRGDRI
jgi:hypothetical protein